MANMQVTNEKNSIVNQYNVEGNLSINHKITVHHHRPQNALPDITDRIVYHLPKLVDSFEGRDSEINLITNWFFTDRKKRVVISGLPGFGKSELAKQFVNLCKSTNQIRHILWMDAETPTKLIQSFKNLAKMLGLPEVDDETLVNMIYDYFKESPTIIIFDNANNRESVAEFEPSNDCLCLITSHVKDWGDDIPSLELTPLSPDSAVSVIRSVLNNRYVLHHYSLYMDLADIVSYVPLALQIVTAFVRQEMIDLGKSFSLEEYIDELKCSQEEFVDRTLPEFSANPYRISIYKAVTKSLRKIEETKSEPAKLALNLLHICAYLYSENIVLSDLLKLPYIKKLLGKTRNPENTLKKAASVLNNYSFVNLVDDQITIHRLIQETLIYHQINLDHHHFYMECLEFVLCDDCKIHRYSIISRADQKIDTFFQFYLKYKETFLSHGLFLTSLVLSGCSETLHKLFEDLGNCSKEKINEFYLLHDAAGSRQHSVLQLLLEHGADVNKINENEENAVFEAAVKLDMKAGQILTDAKSDLNLQSKYGDTILHTIITVSGPPWNDSQLDIACKMLRWLAERGARTDAVNRWLRSTLLHYAALALRPKVVELLVKEFGLNVNEQNALRRIPLHTVSDASKRWFLEKERRIQTAKCLLELGSRLDVVDALGRTPVQHAREEGFEYLAKYLENLSGESSKSESVNLTDVVLDKSPENEDSQLLNPTTQPSTSMNNTQERKEGNQAQDDPEQEIQRGIKRRHSQA